MDPPPPATPVRSLEFYYYDGNIVFQVRALRISPCQDIMSNRAHPIHRFPMYSIDSTSRFSQRGLSCLVGCLSFPTASNNPRMVKTMTTRFKLRTALQSVRTSR